MTHNGQLEGHNVLVVDPVLCRASDKGVLAATGRRVALDRVTASADEVKELGQLDDEVVVVDAVERVGLEKVLVEGGFERPAGEFLATSAGTDRATHVVLLDDLDETGKVELGEEGEVVDVGHEDGDFLFELSESLLDAALAEPLGLVVAHVLVVTAPVVVAVVIHMPLDIAGGSMRVRSFLLALLLRGLFDQPHHLLFQIVDPLEQLIGLGSLELFALFQLVLERLDEIRFGSVVPWEVGLDLLLERAVGDVLVRPLGVARVLGGASASASASWPAAWGCAGMDSP